MKRTVAVPADPIRARCRQALAEHRRRARRDGVAVLPYRLEDLEHLARQGIVCPYCRNLVPPAALTFDHLQPTCRGGRHALDNLTPCCTVCNERKGQLTAEEFRALLQLLQGFHPRAAQDVLDRLRSGGARYARGRRETS